MKTKLSQPSDRGLPRRDFLKTAGAAALALSGGLAGRAQTARPAVRLAPDRPRLAIVGLGGRGRSMALQQMASFFDIVALCDADLRKPAPVAKALEAKTGRKVEIVQDYRRLLDRPDIDVIANATPQHWHARITSDACRAGKDVYSEKPLGLTVDEGNFLRRVVRETGRVVQVGTQQRSGLQFQVACSLVRSGRIGTLKRVGVLVPGSSKMHGDAVTPEPVPPELDWDMWSGQAPLHDFNHARLVAYNWSEYSGGLVCDWGAHHMDIAHWGMGGETVGPLSVEARGYAPDRGQPDRRDQFTPFAARLEYPQGVELWFLSNPPIETGKREIVPPAELDRIYAGVPEDLRKEPRPGVVFTGSTGSIFVGREFVEAPGIGELDDLPLVDAPHARWLASLQEHTRNFVECIRTRGLPRSNVAEQHRTQLPTHLVTIALQLGRKLRWDPAGEAFVDDAEAAGFLRRAQRAPWGLAG